MPRLLVGAKRARRPTHLLPLPRDFPAFGQPPPTQDSGHLLAPSFLVPLFCPFHFHVFDYAMHPHSNYVRHKNRR